MTMSSRDDRLWPPGIPALRFDGPLAVGTHGSHGPIHYEVTAVEPSNGTLMFHFRKPTGLVGHHSFHVSPDGQAGTLLRHEVVANPQGWMRLKWPLMIRWAHDVVVEQVLDQAELAMGILPAPRRQRSRLVTSVLARGVRRLRPDAPPDLESWQQAISDVSSRSRLLQLRPAAGRVLRSTGGSPSPCERPPHD